ncbi:MAG: hypothetical protein OEW90_11560 [Betaproteobacteria bacterium]|nr:hypothetical protein [Betaproteobacteria bacterium]MDH4324765.1 hypothetical protein [Betaproteobacteria bacterium]
MARAPREARSQVTHAEFVAAYRDGHLQVQVDREGAARHVSARLMLPFVLLPLLGLAVALALAGHYVIGALLFIGALGLRYAVRRSAPGFVLQRALGDERFYAEAVAAGLIK